MEGVPQDVSDEEIAAHPDPASCTILPWMPDTAWFASDLKCEGKPFEPCSSNILGRVLANAATMGYGVNVGIEAEFCVLRDQPGGGDAPLNARPNLVKPAYDVARLLESDNDPRGCDLSEIDYQFIAGSEVLFRIVRYVRIAATFCLSPCTGAEYRANCCHRQLPQASP